MTNGEDMKNENRTKKSSTYVRVMAAVLVALLIFGVFAGVLAILL